MQTVAKVLIILSMICLFWSILPLVFGILALGKMKRGEMDTTWKVLTLIFVNPLAGILLLLDK